MKKTCPPSPPKPTARRRNAGRRPSAPLAVMRRAAAAASLAVGPRHRRGRRTAAGSRRPQRPDRRRQNDPARWPPRLIKPPRRPATPPLTRRPAPTSGLLGPRGQSLVEQLAQSGIDQPVPHPGRDDPGRAGRPRRARPRPDRVRQDPRLRAADDRHAGRRRPDRLVRRAAWSWCPPASWPCRSPTYSRRWPALSARGRAGRRRHVVHAAAAGLRARRGHRRRHPRPADRPDGAGRGRPRPDRDHRPRRGRPHGRPGLPARGHPDPRRRPAGGQRLLFSATLDGAVDRLVHAT